MNETPVCAPQYEPVIAKEPDRKRKMEILTIANDLLAIAETRGVKPHEFCLLGRCCEMLR